MGNSSNCQYSTRWIHSMLDVSCEHCEQKEPAGALSKVSPMEAAQSTSNDNNDITVNTARRTHTQMLSKPFNYIITSIVICFNYIITSIVISFNSRNSHTYLKCKGAPLTFGTGVLQFSFSTPLCNM